MTESPVPPPRSPRGLLIVLVFLAGAAVAVGAVFVISQLVKPSAPPASAATQPAGNAMVPTALTASPSQVDALIAADGQPFDLSAAAADYPDAYARIKDDCDTIADVTITPQQWLSAHLLNASVPGEAAALRIGIPLVCPQYNSALLAVEGG